MINVKERLQSVTDRQKWAARGATLMAKSKATKEVWFPPRPVEAGARAASTAKRATKRTAKKTAGTAKKTSARRSSNGTAKKTAAKKGTSKKATAGSRS